MKRLIAVMLIATTGLCGDVAAQRISEKGTKENPPVSLEQVRRAIEDRLTARAVSNVTVTASTDKRSRRITISVGPLNKNPRDDASAALTMAWQPALQGMTAFDEIAVRVGDNYSVICGRRAFADPTISLWGESLTRTCRERRDTTR